ncbi:MAG: hypothetical protein ABL893_03395 [Hyphomicrobium sp.]|nr:hypothetical protein [Hyphomicrobium sp.]
MTARRTLAAAAFAATLLTSLASAEAGQRHASRDHDAGYAPTVRDCTPVNGPHGYYGNAWCDGGFLTLEEQEYRYAKRLDIDRHGFRHRHARRGLFRAR